VVIKLLEETVFHILMKREATVSPKPLVMTLPMRYIYLAQKIYLIDIYLFNREIASSY